MENQENKPGSKHGQHHHNHKHHEGHHEDHGCCSKEKCSESGQTKCCGTSSCCSGHKVAKVFLGLIAIIALLLIGFSWGARMNYKHTSDVTKGWMMEDRSGGCPFKKDGRNCGCQGAGLNSPETETVVPAPTTGTDSQVPLE